MRLKIYGSLLVATFALATALLGWWTVPIIAAAWGALPLAGKRPALAAALGAATAWAILLAVTAAEGPVGELAEKLGGIFGLPGFAVILFTLAYPAILAASAGELAAVVRGALVTDSGSSD